MVFAVLTIKQMTLMTKYKPIYVKDFNMNSDFTSILNLLFKIDDLNLLLIGGTNSGKTTFLYAIVREYYGLKKTDPFPDTNIMFINNLKERGINYYRNEMKTFCRSHSSIHGKKKMVVIDDMDSINEPSQQVFRNYIDKYKNNVNFVSVCSNVNKIIDSIQSRVHILRIESLSSLQTNNIMNTIIQQEGIYIDDAAKQYLLRISGNTIRNVINNLEKIYLFGSSADAPITLDVCKRLCSIISFDKFGNYIDSFELPLVESINILYEIHDYGYSVIDILDYFFAFVKDTDKLSEDQKYRSIPVICKYITIFHKIHEDIIELALFTNDLRRALRSNIQGC